MPDSKFRLLVLVAVALLLGALARPSLAQIAALLTGSAIVSIGWRLCVGAQERIPFVNEPARAPRS